MKTFLSCRRLVAGHELIMGMNVLSGASSSSLLGNAKRFFSNSSVLLQQSTGAPASASAAAGAVSSHSAAAAMYKSSRSGRQRGASSLPGSNKGGVPASSPPSSSSPAPSSGLGSSILEKSIRSPTLDADSKAAASLNCDQESAPEKRPLTALQKRQLAMKDKKVFKLTSRAVDRVNLLLSLHNNRIQQGVIGSNEEGDTKKAVGIRVGVKKKGCSGYSYTVNYEFDAEKLKLKTGGDALVDAMINGSRVAASQQNQSGGGGNNTKISLMGNSPLASSSSSSSAFTPSDVHVDQDGVHIFVEGSALFYVIGTVMDFTVSNVEEKFTFQNPNQAHSCGCGESFMPFGV